MFAQNTLEIQMRGRNDGQRREVGRCSVALVWSHSEKREITLENRCRHGGLLEEDKRETSRRRTDNIEKDMELKI